MKGRQFIDLSTNKIVKVIDSFEDIAILEGNAKIRASRLLDGNFFEPYIDPNTFFKTDDLLNDFANRIKQIPVEHVRDDEKTISVNNFEIQNDLAVLPYDPEEEARELMRRYNIPQQNMDVLKQNEAFSKLLTDEPVQITVNRDQSINELSDGKVQQIVVERTDDPIIMMFKNCKRTLEFKLDLSVNEKIPRTDFIEMMEDSYSTSIIDYLSEEFTNKLLNDPSEIKRRIKDEIMKKVYPNKKPSTKITKPTSRKPPVKKTDNSSVIKKEPRKTASTRKKITEDDKS